MALNLYDIHVPPYVYANGCIPTVTAGNPLNILTISSGIVRDDTNTVNIVLNDPLVISQTGQGANGLDTGTIAQNTMYTVYLVADPSGLLPPAGLLSLSSTNPIMPAVRGTTYGVKRRIGYACTTAGTSPVLFTPTYVTGLGNTRTLMYAQLDQNNQVFNGEAATSVTAIPLTTRVPKISVGFSWPMVYMTNNISATANDRVLWNSVGGVDISTSVLRSVVSVTGEFQSFGMFVMPASPDGGLDPLIFYQGDVDAGMTLVVNILGFTFEI